MSINYKSNTQIFKFVIYTNLNLQAINFNKFINLRLYLRNILSNCNSSIKLSMSETLFLNVFLLVLCDVFAFKILNMNYLNDCYRQYLG